MFFRLKAGAGPHADKKNGKDVVYRQGDLIESDRDLRELFPSKFVRVMGSGEVVEYPKDDLIELEPKQAGEEDIEVPDEIPAPKVLKTSLKASKKAEDSKTSASLGTNVTKKFPRAEEEDFSVFSKGGEFFVTEADDPGKALNDQPLKKKDVQPFIEKYLKS